MYLLCLSNLGNCEENDFHFLYRQCVATSSELAKLKRILATDKFYSNEFTCGCHGCVLELYGLNVAKSMTSRSITSAEARVLIKFNVADMAALSQWYMCFVKE